MLKNKYNEKLKEDLRKCLIRSDTIVINKQNIIAMITNIKFTYTKKILDIVYF